MSALRPLTLLVVLASVACASERADRRDEGGDRKHVSVSLSSDSGVRVTSSPSTGSGAGDTRPSFTEEAGGGVSMKSTNGALVMSLRHDSVLVAFSDSLRDAVKREVNQEMKKDARDTGDGAFAEVIKGVVQKSVTAGLSEIFDKARGFPVSSLSDVRYERGAIEFEYARKPTWTFDNMKVDKTPILESFHPADAARFVGAVRARIKRS